MLVRKIRYDTHQLLKHKPGLVKEFQDEDNYY